MRSPNFSSRYGKKIKFIVVHWWNLPRFHRNGDPSGVIRELCNPASKKSAHAVIYPGGIVELVDPKYSAWATRGVNRQSISIECWPWDEKSPKALVSAAQENLARQIAHYYTLYPHLIGVRLHAHSEHFPTACPGDYWRAYLGKIHSRAVSIYRGEPHITNNLVVDQWFGSKSIKRLQQVMHTPVDGVISGQPIANRRFLPNASTGWQWTTNPSGSTAITAWQRKIGAVPDGFFGPKSVRLTQKFLGVTADNYAGPRTMGAWQIWLNNQK